jgi:high-affinity iron transporter
MLDALLVTFREGLESFLIVGVIVGYLRKTNRAALVRGVHLGVALAVVASLIGAWLWLQVPNQPLYEGIAALTAALLVGLLLVQMMRMGRHLKGQIESRVERIVGTGTGTGTGTGMGGSAGTRGGIMPMVGVTLVTLLLVTRELLEAVFYLGVKAMAVHAAVVPLQGALVVVGAVLGLVIAGFLAWYWSRYSHKLNLGVLLKVTALFLGLFLLQLCVYGVHELAESGVIHGSQAFHDATEILGPDGTIGHFISYSLLAAPLLYLFWARRARAQRRHPPAVCRPGPPTNGAPVF